MKAGGEMNLTIGAGQDSVLGEGPPTRSYFHMPAPRKYTPSGFQKFRLDALGQPTLQLENSSTFSFQVPRYADLLSDAMVCVTLPNVWSPIMPPDGRPLGEKGAQGADGQGTQGVSADAIGEGVLGNGDCWAPYEFKWIEHIGAKMIAKIAIVCGNLTLQEYSGDYLLAAVQRDFSDEMRAKFDEMTGHVPEVMDPANANGRVNMYPNAYWKRDYDGFARGPEPSVRGRTLYVPINAWFTLCSEAAFPLCSLQNNELFINVTFRPVNELFVVRDVFDAHNQFPYIAPRFTKWYMQLHRFLQPPPNRALEIGDYSDTRVLWNANVHLMCTYVFLAEPERAAFIALPQRYAFKQVREQTITNVSGPNRVDLKSLGLVASWLFYFQRSDAGLRNEWSNYTNWPYAGQVPLNAVEADSEGDHAVVHTVDGEEETTLIGPGVNPDGSPTGFVLAPLFSAVNARDILVAMGISLDGNYRENVLPAGVYDLMEKYTRTTGHAPRGLLCYAFGMHSGQLSGLQPSGQINMNSYQRIELEFTTITPPINPFAQSMVVCDPGTGNIVGINKPSWSIYEYTYDLHIFEERVNFIVFSAGNCALQLAT